MSTSNFEIRPKVQNYALGRLAIDFLVRTSREIMVWEKSGDFGAPEAPEQAPDLAHLHQSQRSDREH